MGKLQLLACLGVAGGLFFTLAWMRVECGTSQSTIQESVSPSPKSTSTSSGSSVAPSLAGSSSPCGFRDFFESHNQGPGIHKWLHYFPIYEEVMGRFCTGSGEIRMAEIGIQSGGSMLMWRHAFGSKLKLLLGLDINPNTKAWERFGSNVKVEIGSQSDAAFLEAVSNKYPEGFDIILDDGSHVSDHQFVTFCQLWPAVRSGGVFIIEDVTGYNPLIKWLLFGHNLPQLNSSLPRLYWSGSKYSMDGRGKQDGLPDAAIQDEIESIKLYPFMIVIAKRSELLTSDTLKATRHGSQWIPYAAN